MGQKWVTVSQACLSYGVSRRTLTRRIKQGKVESKLENNRRYVLVVDSETAASQGETQEGQVETEEGQHVSGMSQEISQQLIERLESDKQLQADQIAELKEQNKALQEELAEARRAADEAGKRHDTVIMQMTRLLEYEQLPFWRKLFSRKALPPPEQIMDMEPGEKKEAD